MSELYKKENVNIHALLITVTYNKITPVTDSIKIKDMLFKLW